MRRNLILSSPALVLLCLTSNTALAQSTTQQCLLIQESLTRLECYDQALGFKSEAQPSSNVTSAPTNAAESLQEPFDDFGIEDRQSPEEKAEERILTVSSATHNQFTGWTISFENGQSWKQIGTNRYSIKVGEKYTIRRAALNSFRLGNLDNNRSIKVSRVE